MRFFARRKGLPFRLGTAGAVAVEFGLTAPYLLAFCYGILEVSHYAYLRIFLNNIAHDGTRYAIVHGSASADPLTSANISSYVTGEMTSLGLTSTAAVVTVTYNSSNAPGNTVKVQISYPFTPFMAGFDSIVGVKGSFTALAGPIAVQSQMVIGQ